jgi:hypothetical protein
MVRRIEHRSNGVPLDAAEDLLGLGSRGEARG